MNQVNIKEQLIVANTKKTVRFRVTTGLNGAPLDLTASIATGDPNGPVLTLVSTLHGGEWFSIAPLKRAFERVDTDSLKGSLIVVPAANPPAFGRRSRNMPNQQDSPDMNRIFPGPLTSTADQLASVLANEILSVSDCLLDFHMGPWGSAFRDILLGSDYLGDASDRALELALACWVAHHPIRTGPDLVLSGTAPFPWVRRRSLRDRRRNSNSAALDSVRLSRTSGSKSRSAAFKR